MELSCNAALAEAILTDAAERSPQEACGLVLGIGDGSGWRATTYRALPNHAAEPRNGFEIEPLAFLRVEAEARAVGHSLLGLFHSHPEGPAEPSRRDLAETWPTPTAWIAGRDGRLAVWRRRADGRAEAVALVLVAS